MKKAQKEKGEKEAGMPKQTIALLLLGMGVIAFILIFLLTGLFAPAPSPPSNTTPSFMVQVPGDDHGTVILIGRTGCPWCQKTKDLLASMSVGYSWVDLSTLTSAQMQQVVAEASRVCSSTDSVPILIVNGQCVVGYDEARIRELLG